MSTDDMDSIRNKRFLASIQSSLGNKSPTFLQTATGSRNSKQQENDGGKEVQSLSEAIQKITISNGDVSSSIRDIKPFLKKNLDSLTDDECAQLSSSLLENALEQTDIYPIIDICIELIAQHKFQIAMSDCIKKLIGKYLSQQENETSSTININNVPAILAQLLICKWPRRFNRAIEGSNAILFTITNTLIGWIQFINEKCAEKTDESLSDDESALLLRCIEGLIMVCNTGQRYLWLAYPELYDQIYNTQVEILVSNLKTQRRLKISLLNLCNQMMKWCQANTAKYSNVGTQTVNKGF